MIDARRTHGMPDDQLTDDALIGQLRKFDEELREGRRDPQTPVPELVETADGDSVFDCLRLLERAFPRTRSEARGHSIPDRIGRFLIERVLGQGGFGIVYQATDPSLKRQVALKVPRLHVLASSNMRERFRREARAAAALDHPHVIPVYEAGEDGPVCYIASAYVAGPTLSQWLKDQSGVTLPRTAALIVSKLADAVQYSHAHGVLHRDIKPGNILLAPNDRAASNELPFTPRLGDFGLAKLIEDFPTDGSLSVASETGGGMLGTPAYMAPEQLGGGDKIRAASDVYGLGAVLYEILTGRAPFQGASIPDILDQVRNVEPVPIRRLRPDVPRDLETICQKCLEKNPAKRYTAAAGLFDDLDRFLRGETILAKPPGARDVATKWVRRHKVVVLAACAVFLSLVSGICIAAWQALEAIAARGAAEKWLSLEKAARVEADAHRMTAENNAFHARNASYANAMRVASDAWRRNDIARMREVLASQVPSAGEQDLRGFEWHFLDRQIGVPPQEVYRSDRPLYYVGLSPSGKQVVTCGADGKARIFRNATFEPVIEIDCRQGELNCADFSTDSKQLVTAGDDGSVVVWELSPLRERLRFRAHDEAVFQARFARANSLLVTCGVDPIIRVWNATDGSPLGALEHHKGTVQEIKVGVGGNLLAVSSDGDGSLWDLDTRQLIDPVLTPDLGAANCAGVTSNGDGFAIGKKNGMLWLEIAGLKSRQRMPDAVHSLAFLPYATGVPVILAVGDRSGDIHLLPADGNRSSTGITESETRTQQGRQWHAHTGRVYSLVFTMERKRLLSAGEDGALMAWSVKSLRSSDVISSGVRDFCLHCWDYENKRDAIATAKDASPYVHRLDPDLKALGLSSESQNWIRIRSPTASNQVWALNADGSIHYWKQIPKKRNLHKQARAANPDESPVDFDVSPDALRYALIVNLPNGSCILELRHLDELAARRIPLERGRKPVFSPDGNSIAYVDGNFIRILEWQSGLVVRTLEGHRGTVNEIAFAKEDDILASVSDDRALKVWDWRSGRQVWSQNAHANGAYCVAFSPDGQTLVTAGRDDMLRLWRWTFGAMTFELPLEDSGVGRVAFSSDGLRIVTLGDGLVRIYYATPRQPREPAAASTGH